MEIKVGDVSSSSIGDVQHRMSALLWGQAGSGKTTLAATAPGNKLWINFDEDGTASVASRSDISLLDFSMQPNKVVTQFRDENSQAIRDIDKALEQLGDDVGTVVVDSVTSFGEKALAYGVVDASKSGATLEDPGFKGFGRKNTWTRMMVVNLLRVTAKHGKHIVFVCHEDVASRDKEGSIVHITLMVGSNLAQEVPVKFSECWHVQDTGKKRLIRIRPDSFFRPMKTRLFKTDGPVRFEWKFDPETQEGEGISTWYQRWVDNGYQKIEVPK